jgi:hypothetical protein
MHDATTSRTATTSRGDPVPDDKLADAAPQRALGRERQRHADGRRAGVNWSRWLTWTAGFVAFPLAGLAGRAVAGRVDDPLAALVGGGVAGAVIGTGQWLASRREVGEPAPWIGASTGGIGVGLLAGAAIVNYETGLGDLALMGAITGVSLGAAQALVLAQRWPRAWAWGLAIPALWALGWIVSTAIGVDVERQYVVFGSAGAITVMASSGLLFEWIRAGQQRHSGA